MKKIHYLFSVCAIILSSCAEDENGSCKVDIRLKSHDGYPKIPYEEIWVTLTSQSQGAIYKSRCTAEGIAHFEVENGYYSVSAYYQSPSGMIFSGRIESLPLLPEKSGTSETVELGLSRSEANALVIKEIYYGGCTGSMGEGYQADQYVTLYNNSEETLYLDGLCIGVVDPPTGLESPWMKYTDMSKIPVNDLTWQFPGTGKDYPLAPGAETTIATNAVNHTGGEYQQANSVDLSGVDWGFWDVSLSRQDIQPGVKPMKLIAKFNPNTFLYTFPVIGPTLMVFGLQGVTAESYVADVANRESRPQANNQNKFYLMIPKEWVIDCVECVENVGKVTNKRVPAELNNTPVYIPEGVYSGKSLVRKKRVDADGRIVYQDTNNSSEDFEASTPLLKK